MATSYRLKRKTFNFLGIGNMTKNWNAGTQAFKQGNKMAGVWNRAKAIGTGGVYATGAAALLAAPTIFKKMTGED